MSHSLQMRFLIFLVLGLVACQDSGSDEARAVSDPPISDVARFHSEMSKSGCELLSAKLVSETFDVPADALRQMKIAGCRYDWQNDTQTLEAAIMMVQAHKSEAGATRWFESATRNKTAEEMKAEMEMVSSRLDQQKELDTELKKSTAKNLLATVDSKAVNFEDVAGLGDEARVSGDGTVYVRVDNLTFMVSAYQGAQAPPLDMKEVDFTDVKQIAAVAKERAAEWASETAPQRKKDGTRLATAIVDEL